MDIGETQKDNDDWYIEFGNHMRIHRESNLELTQDTRQCLFVMWNKLTEEIPISIII